LIGFAWEILDSMIVTVGGDEPAQADATVGGDQAPQYADRAGIG
jgi:hypothetical protein